MATTRQKYLPDARLLSVLATYWVYWLVMAALLIRKTDFEEHDSVRALVQNVVDETYGGVWAQPPLHIDEEDWGLAWIGVIDSKIVGMVLTHGEWVSDLWVLRENRRRGIGQKLLCAS